MKHPVYQTEIDGFCQPPSGGCVLKHLNIRERQWGDCPAAFRRLCVETFFLAALSCAGLPAAFRRLCVETTNDASPILFPKFQPPSGGCVLKLHIPYPSLQDYRRQPPSGGCVLKQYGGFRSNPFRRQPPSGGCVLKQTDGEICRLWIQPAAFRRLCVETMITYR